MQDQTIVQIANVTKKKNLESQKFMKSEALHSHLLELRAQHGLQPGDRRKYLFDQCHLDIC